MPVLDFTNKSGVDYTISARSQLMKHLEPFFACLPGQKGFCYIKIMDNGTRLYLSTVKNWVGHYVSSKFQDDINHLKYNVPEENFKISFWSGYEKDAVIETSFAYDIWHGFSIHERQEDYCEYFDFFTHKENHLFPTQCFNSLETIKCLIKEFKVKAESIIDASDPRKLIVSKKWIPFSKIWDSSLRSPEKSKLFLKSLKKPIESIRLL